MNAKKLRLVNSFFNTFTSFSRRSLSSHNCFKKSSSVNSNSSFKKIQRFTVCFFNLLYLAVFFSLITVVANISSVIKTLYKILKSCAFILYSVFIFPLFIPYVAYTCTRKTIGLSPKGHKITLDIFGDDYVLDFEDQDKANTNIK